RAGAGGRQRGLRAGMSAADDDDVETVEGLAHGAAILGRSPARGLRESWHASCFIPGSTRRGTPAGDDRTEQGPVQRMPRMLEGRISGDVRPSLFPHPLPGFGGLTRVARAGE